MNARAADAYTLADAARRLGVGGVVTRLKPQTRASQFHGRALTARVRHTPHTPVPLADYGIAELLERIGPGDVMVLDMGGLQFTGMGDIVATYLARQGVMAAVVNGLIRDAEEIEETGLPVFSLGVGIGTIAGRGMIEGIGEPVWLDGIRFGTGDMVAGCRGGVVCVAPQDERAVLAVAAEIQASDRSVVDALVRGEPATQIWKRHKSLPLEPGTSAKASV
jgi:regulator of RNase E activity RraA